MSESETVVVKRKERDARSTNSPDGGLPGLGADADDVASFRMCVPAWQCPPVCACDGGLGTSEGDAAVFWPVCVCVASSVACARGLARGKKAGRPAFSIARVKNKIKARTFARSLPVRVRTYVASSVAATVCACRRLPVPVRTCTASCVAATVWERIFA